jgi:hypothetical protein
MNFITNLPVLTYKVVKWKFKWNHFKITKKLIFFFYYYFFILVTLKTNNSYCFTMNDFIVIEVISIL